MAGPPVIGVEATGRLHHAWVAELERRWPGSVRLFAPSQTQAARTQLGSRRAKTDDRDCAALVWLVRQGHGGPPPPTPARGCWGRSATGAGWSPTAGSSSSASMTSSRRCAPAGRPRPGHGRALHLDDPTGQAVLAAAAAFAGRPPTIRSLQARPRGRVTQTTAGSWVDRWRRLLAPPADAELRAERLGRDLARHQRLQADIAAVEAQISRLLAATPGQILTTLPGVAVVRAASFAAHSLPIDRFPTPEHRYAATGLAPATWQSTSLHRRGRISRQGLAEHRDALMGIAWGLSQHSVSFRERDAELRGRGLRPIQACVALAGHACRLCYALLRPSSPLMKRAIVLPGTVAGGDGQVRSALRRRMLACRPLALATSDGAHQSLPA